MKLPSKMSQLILVALKDLAKVEKDSRYRINMNMYHGTLWQESEKCPVCLAGAVMAKTLKTPIHEMREPTDWPKGIREKLYAIDYLRVGDINSAADELNIKPPRAFKFSDVNIISYERNKRKFHRDMKKLASDLKKVGY